MSKRADGSYSSAWRGLTKIVVPALLAATTKHEWHGQDYIRGVSSSSGVILAANHLSYADPLPLCLFTHRAGRYPVFLAKSSLFEIKGLGAVMRGTGQLPVYRGQSDAALLDAPGDQAPAHTVPSRASRSTVINFPSSSGTCASLPLFQPASPLFVPIQRVPSRTARRLKITLLGRC